MPSTSSAPHPLNCWATGTCIPAWLSENIPPAPPQSSEWCGPNFLVQLVVGWDLPNWWWITQRIGGFTIFTKKKGSPEPENWDWIDLVPSLLDIENIRNAMGFSHGFTHVLNHIPWGTNPARHIRWWWLWEARGPSNKYGCWPTKVRICFCWSSPSINIIYRLMRMFHLFDDRTGGI
jgi:hypothetical protein